ncbi:hypothetical protein ALC57_03450, partial [Trachymyrmex cornetzi]
SHRRGRGSNGRTVKSLLTRGTFIATPNILVLRSALTENKIVSFN